MDTLVRISCNCWLALFFFGRAMGVLQARPGLPMVYPSAPPASRTLAGRTPKSGRFPRLPLPVAQLLQRNR
jgi:hypothetical protein